MHVIFGRGRVLRIALVVVALHVPDIDVLVQVNHTVVVLGSARLLPGLSAQKGLSWGTQGALNERGWVLCCLDSCLALRMVLILTELDSVFLTIIPLGVSVTFEMLIRRASIAGAEDFFVFFTRHLVKGDRS